MTGIILETLELYLNGEIDMDSLEDRIIPLVWSAQLEAGPRTHCPNRRRTSVHQRRPIRRINLQNPHGRDRQPSPGRRGRLSEWASDTMTTLEERVSSMEGAYDHLATKADLERLRGELMSEMRASETRLVKWNAGMMIGGLVAMAALLRLFV